jgi:hypothetical protein
MITAFLILCLLALGVCTYVGVTRWIIPTPTKWTKFTYSGILAFLWIFLIVVCVRHWL